MTTMSQDTKLFLTLCGVETEFWHLLVENKLYTTNILKQTTFKSLKDLLGMAVARYIYDKINPPKTLNKNIRTFLLKCGINKELIPIFERLHDLDIPTLELLTKQHIIDCGMELWEAEVSIYKIKSIDNPSVNFEIFQKDCVYQSCIFIFVSF